MSETEYLRFVGGQEDGNYYEVPAGVSEYRVLDRVKPDVIANDGTKACNEEAKVFVYVRRGKEMALI